MALNFHYYDQLTPGHLCFLSVVPLYFSSCIVSSGGNFQKTSISPLYLHFSSILYTLNWFPEISNQYVEKSTLFLTPGNFLADKFNFVLVQDLAKIFYQNFFVGQQLVYAILFAAALYGIARILIYIHEYISNFIVTRELFSRHLFCLSRTYLILLWQVQSGSVRFMFSCPFPDFFVLIPKENACLLRLFSPHSCRICFIPQRV